MSGLHTKHGCVFIGYQAGYNESADNKLYVENSSSTEPLIYGDFLVNELGLLGDVGIYTKSPGAELHVRDGGDVGADATIRMQSVSSNNDCIIDFYENTAPAMSIYYSGSGNNLQLIDLTADTTRVTFERNGDVGIANANPTHLLDVGVSGAFCDGGVWVNGSSRKFKTDIRDLSTADALEAFKELKPVRFRYKADPDEEYLGFIAEDVPQLVATNDRAGLAAMDVVAVLTKTVQELSKQVESMQSNIEMLEHEIAELKKTRGSKN